MLEAGESQPEVVEPMIERLARDGDAEPAHVGEVRQAQPSRRMLLAKDHLAVGTVERAPAGDAALQRPPHARGDAWMPAAKLLENRHGANAGRGFHHRHDLAVPHPGKRSGRRRPRGFLFCDGSRGSLSIR